MAVHDYTVVSLKRPEIGHVATSFRENRPRISAAERDVGKTFEDECRHDWRRDSSPMPLYLWRCIYCGARTGAS